MIFDDDSPSLKILMMVTGQTGGAASRISSASSSDNGGSGAGGGGSGGGGGGGGANSGGGGGGGANPLLSPCSVMEEASSPGSTTSQLSYLGALQSPATSLTPLGFPAPYLLKDSAGLAAAAAAAGVGGGGGGGGPKKKEGKPGSDVRSFGCQVTPCLRAWCLVIVRSGLPSVGHPLMDPIIFHLAIIHISISVLVLFICLFVCCCCCC